MKEKRKRLVSGLMALLMLFSSINPALPITVWGDEGRKPGDSIFNGTEDMIGYCIDSFELLGEAGGIMGGVKEKYTYVFPSTKLSDEECAILFWGTLSMLAGKGDSECKRVYDAINAGAPAAGLRPLVPAVTENDLKKLIHSQAVRNKYPWISAVVANQDKYMELAGLKGSDGGTSMGGKEIPAVLRDHKDESSALEVDKNTFTIPFDASGADREFIQKVPIKFSLTGGEPWSETPIGGWTYQKTDTSIIFTNPNPQPSKMMIQFDPTGTEFQKGGGYSSPEDMYDKTMELWVCTRCSGLHVYHSAPVMPLEAHQRMVNLNLWVPVDQYYAALAGDPVVSSGGGEINFEIYRHEEEMTSTYNLQLYKYDHETGKPLENSTFKLYERFDDKGEIDREKDGPVHIYEGGEPYKSYHKDSPAVWDDFKFVSGMVTDENGYSAKTVNHGYHYDKTFCDGHPAPQFVGVPEEEEDEETGEITNEDEIQAAQEENQKLAQSWLDCYLACETHASGEFEGVHFHWLMPEVDKGTIESVRESGGSPGETPSAGKIESASAEDAYRESGCQEDCEETYDKFISLRYSYALVESAARPGYILHDIHNDDLPVEVITTDSSENGANAVFANEYGKDIGVNDEVGVKGAEKILEQRKNIETLRLREMLAISEKKEEGRELLKKEISQYYQDPLRYLVPLELPKDGEEMGDEGEIDLIDDISGTGSILPATQSNSSLATSSDTSLATASDAMYAAQVQFSRTYDEDGFYFDWTKHDREIDQYAEEKAGQNTLFMESYNTALNDTSSGESVEPGPEDNYSHCSGQDGEGDAWRIYDHRTEGELHINKRDMELEAGESDAYDSYGDTQGDGTLEGAVYGLFAATDIIHPDGKTGVVYRANNLVAIATTDKNGDASFMVNTEAPGHVYDYEKGEITGTEDGWVQQAPKNLYAGGGTYDDYTEDGAYVRAYPDYEAENGNCWIGRPLIMGNYYVKELTRSEGYELSIGNKDNALTNLGQAYDTALPTGNGYANISRRLYAEGQISPDPTGEYGNPDVNELFFTAESRETGANGFDVVLSGLPAGTKVYRLDTGTKVQEVPVGTGVYHKEYLTNPDGTPKYVTAENDYQYPKYQADGSLMTEEKAVHYEAKLFPQAAEKPLDAEKTKTALEAAEPSMTQEQVAAKLAEEFTVSAFDFLKGKTERALRASGKKTPKLSVGGKADYSSIYVGIYDAGVREGEKDIYGVSGVRPGEPAEKTVYGAPVVTVKIPKADQAGTPLKTGDVILSVLDFYNTNSFYYYGGVHAVEESADSYLITVYANFAGVPANVIVPGDGPEQDGVIYHRVEYVPEDPEESPRYIYADYSNDPDKEAFGSFENYTDTMIGDSYFASATLVTDAVALPDGTLKSRTVKENVYYKTGETPFDEQGNPIRAFEYREETVMQKQEVSTGSWTELKAEEVGDVLAVHVDSNYTDSFGAAHQDGELQSYELRAVLPEKYITLTEEDIAQMQDGSGWSAGDEMGSGAYYLHVNHARAKAYLNYRDLAMMGDSSFVEKTELVYPGQQYIWQDGSRIPGSDTRKAPIGVQERPIKQTVKVTKTIREASYNNTNSYTDVHTDWWTELFGASEKRMDNFRFKAYLKSNLTRLYRNEEGEVIWQNRKGNEIDPIAANEQFPALVSDLFTKVPHAADPLYRDSNDAAVANEALYSFDEAGQLQSEPNSGYTAILETAETVQDDGEGTRLVASYNYDKFFDAIAVANQDKWDDANQTYTSEQPIGNAANRTEFSVENAKSSDMVRQFAIRWYLDDEIEKLVKDVPNQKEEQEDSDSQVTYSDALYDEALHEALVKAENYLKPFFLYDLDEIYAIRWDSEENGGKDKDSTTLSADKLSEGADGENGGYYYGVSAYLPYGTYVLAEQQPKYADMEDFKNRHYQIDRPKEVELPSVYAGYEQSQAKPEALNTYYNYKADMPLNEMERRFEIRFAEEHHVLQAHNNCGDFEVYKYGEDISRLNNGVPDAPAEGDYFAVTQSEWKPDKDYYNPEDDRTAGEVSYYLTEGKSGRTGIAEHYRYSSVSEDAGTANCVPFPEAEVTKDNPQGQLFRDDVAFMQGMQTAYDGKYAAMLVPYTVVKPANAESEKSESALGEDGESSYHGYGYSKFENRFFTTKLRIEKLDSETHENILHDDAIFSIYAAKRDDSAAGEGHVLFYEEDTTISGTKEFLEAMGAKDIRPAKRRAGFIDRLTGKPYGAGNLYAGVVAAGTPICEESERIVLGDAFGNQTVAFKSYTTTGDLLMKDKNSNTERTYQDQTVGYLETPQPLGAGVYVLCEDKAPSGYTRSKPIAVEVYSDKVSYYKEGEKDKRVAAAIYENPSDHLTAHGNKPQDKTKVARVHVENAPIKLQVEKVKKKGAVTFKIGEREEGSLTEIGGNPKLEYAYENGQYLGYGYAKGTLEYLKALKDAGEDVELVYENGQFAGYGYVTRTRDTDDDENPYVAGAKLTLFDAIELTPSGDTEDHAFDGLQINRNRTGNVLEMFVKKGYAGERTEMIKDTDENGQELLTEYVVGVDPDENPIRKAGYVWKADTVERPDTDILFYDLDSLSVTWTEKTDGKDILYGWDKDHQKTSIYQIESDKQNHKKSDREPSVYAFKGGQAYLEFVGGDLTKIKFNPKDKILEGDFAQLERVADQQKWKLGDGTVVYHIDRNGNRDARVDPYTGMAYILEPELDAAGNHIADKVLVWAVNLAKDQYGNVIARDKITTSRVATIGENQDGYQEEAVIEPINKNPEGQQLTDDAKPQYSHQESGYVTGTWKSEGGEESHKETTQKTNKFGQNMNEEVLVNDNNGAFLKYLNPVYDEHGLVLYYQRSSETYDKGTNLYDRNGDFVRYKDSDQLEEYNRASYALDDDDTLYDGLPDQENQSQQRLYHREGEGYILENTWLTSDQTPNDPFSTKETAGQADLLKRLPAGTYILEELAVPEGSGYTKSLPTGISVDGSDGIKQVTVADDTTKLYIQKLDAPETGREEVDLLEYSYTQVSNAKIALYPAKYITDLTKPDGYRLEKTLEAPFVFESTNSNAASIEKLTASWTTGMLPIYAEGIPAGYYILEESSAPEEEGFIKAAPVYVRVDGSQEIQSVTMPDDHTKVAVWKYKLAEGSKQPLSGARFALYEAQLDAEGKIVMEDGVPQYHADKMVDSWISDDAGDYTESINLKDYPNTSGENRISGFMTEFEKMYSEYGVAGQGFRWSAERTALRDNTESGVWTLEDGTRIVVAKDGNVTFPADMSREDREGFKAAYADMIGKKRILKWAVTRTAKVEGIQKIDISDAGGSAQKYPNTATITLSVQETGKTVLAKVVYDGKKFQFSYKFDYQKLSVNAYANSWLTADGMHRIDYLPVGSKLVLVEEQAPAGFALALPKTVEVGNVVDIQTHEILNEQDALLISKKSAETGKEFAGNRMALYQADETGKLTESDQYLIEEWISGSDGTYEEKDLINGLIPEGFQEGDLKPHYIYNLENGRYFLVEVLADAYYTALEPIEINYVGGQQLQLVEAVNYPVKGKLVITKTDENDRKLNGVVFELSAFDAAGNMVLGFPRQVADTGGVVTVTDLPVGTAKTDGSIEPFTYKLRELVPPAGYAVNSEIFTFSFENGADSYSKNPEISIALQEIQVRNEKTRLYIEKKDLSSLEADGTDGAFVQGALLALYRVSSITENGEYTYQPEDLFEEWTTSKTEGRHLLEGLVAGQSYILTEKKAPQGYNLMKPVLLTVSENGRFISEISNNLSVLKVHTVEGKLDNPDTDSIAALTIRGRIVQKTEISVLDEQGTEVLRFAGTKEDHVIHESDGLQEGGVYTFAEHTLYSDGSDVVTAKITRRVHFGENGFIYHGRTADKALLQVSDGEGKTLSEFYPMAEKLEQMIDNHVNPENPAVTMKSRNEEAGTPIRASQPVIHTITYYNPSPVARDVEVEAVLDSAASILDPYSGIAEGNTIRWTIPNVTPYTQGNISFASSVDRTDVFEVSTDVTVKVNGKTCHTRKCVPIQKDNQLTVYNELIGSGKETHAAEESVFTIRMWDERGNELAGRYAYTGSKEGYLRSGDSIILAGNEFITVNPGNFVNCIYEVTRKENGLDIVGHCVKGIIEEEGSSAWFTRSVQDTSERQIFAKGETYYLTETTGYSDGHQRISSKFSFTLNENAGISAVGGYDKESEVSVSKTNMSTGEELPGNHMEIVDKDGNVTHTWVSGEKPYEIKGLTPGESYTLRETSPADGFSYAEEITFTVNQDGTVDQILMENKPTHIVVSKQDITNSEELPGAHLELIDQNGDIVEAWISGDKPHEIVGKLIADSIYTLRETIPADGFVIAGEISFTVSHDGRIDYVTMKDDTTKVRIYKNEYGKTATPSDADSGKPVAGSTLQILNEDKSPALYQGKEMIFTTGASFLLLEKMLVAGRTYWLHEVKPTPGYAYAEDVKFTVSMDGSVDVVLMEDKLTEAYLSKKDITGEEELPGNHMQLTDEKGMVIDQWISGRKPHAIVGKLEADHMYTLIEVSPKPGYAYAKDVTFTVNHDGTPNYVEMRDDVTKAEILKIDAGSGQPLEGAEFELLDKEKRVVETWVSTKEAYRIHGKLTAGETYILHEVKAPNGYRKMADISFTMNQYADVLKITVENTKIPGGSGGGEGPGKEVPPEMPPEEVPEIPANKGKITAKFDSSLYGFGKAMLNYDGSVIDLTVKTGDEFPIALLTAAAVTSLFVLLGVLFMYIKKKWKKTAAKILGICLITTSFFMMKQISAYAASEPETTKEAAQYLEKIYLSDTDEPEKQEPDFDDFVVINGKTYVLDSIHYEVQSRKKTEESIGSIKIVTSSPFTDEASDHVPESEMMEGGITYYLQSYEIVETIMDARTEPVSDTIQYSDIPVNSLIPGAAKLSVEDPVTGKHVTVQVPLSVTEYGEPHWVDTFQFPITVSRYDASVFDLNGKEVSLAHDMPLAGYESDLLQMIGVSQEDYRINSIQWDGEAYTENGMLCRNLKAEGEMRVVDCSATYSGIVNLPEVEAKAVQAVYADRPANTDSDDESGYTYTMKATAKYVVDSETLTRKTFLDHLIDFLTDPVVVAIILLLLLIILILWMISRKKKKKEKKILYQTDDSEEIRTDSHSDLF